MQWKEQAGASYVGHKNRLLQGKGSPDGFKRESVTVGFVTLTIQDFQLRAQFALCGPSS